MADAGRHVIADRKWPRALVGAIIGAGVGAYAAQYSELRRPADIAMRDVGFFEAITTGRLITWLHLHAPDEPYITIAYALVFAVLAGVLAAYQ